MSDDTSKRGARDRAEVAGGETYEVDYFANKHGLSRDEAQKLIDRVGNNREKLDAAAAQRAAPKRRAAPSNAARAQSSRKQKAAAGSRPKPRGAGSQPRAAAARRVAPASNGRTAKLVGAAAAGLVAGLAVNLGRKAVVQAPSALSGDWLEALKTEHKLALALFDKLQVTDDSATRKRSVLLTQLKHALGKHAFTEENVVYPALREWGDKADADKLNHDHGYVKQYLYELEGMDNASPAFLPKVREFRADLEAHMREEEDAIFPPLHAALGEAGNARVTALANKEGFKLA